MAEAATTTPAQGREKFIASDVSVRTTLAFEGAGSAIQSMLPTGWKLTSSPSGPTKEFNLTLILIDTVMI